MCARVRVCASAVHVKKVFVEPRRMAEFQVWVGKVVSKVLSLSVCVYVCVRVCVRACWYVDMLMGWYVGMLVGSLSLVIRTR